MILSNLALTHEQSSIHRQMFYICSFLVDKCYTCWLKKRIQLDFQKT